MKPIDLMELLDELPEEDIAEELNYQPIPKRRTFLVSMPFLARASTAACLLLIVGLGVGVWSRQQKIETRPPQETQTTTVTQTETRKETTAQITTEAKTTGKQTEERIKKPETTTIPALNSDQLQQPTSAVALLTTVAPTETMTSTVITRQTNVSTNETQQNTPPAVTTRITSPQTSMTARIHGQIEPVTEQRITPEVTDHTQPSEPPKKTSTSFQETNATAPIATETTTDAVEPITLDESMLPWFVIEEVNGNRRIRCLQAVEPSPVEWIPYTIQSDRFELHDTHKYVSAGDYTVYDPVTDRLLNVRQDERTAFCRTWNSDVIPTVTFVEKYPGYIWEDPIQNSCGVVWDDGCYTFVIQGRMEMRSALLPLAESVCQAGLLESGDSDAVKETTSTN